MTDLTPANENPWYVLMTLYGDDQELNRKTWNAWAGQALTKDQSNKVQFSPYFEELHMWDKLKDGIEKKFSDKVMEQEVGLGLPVEFPSACSAVNMKQLDLKNRIDLSGFTFPRCVEFSASVFGSDLHAHQAIFLSRVSFSNTKLEHGLFLNNVKFHEHAIFEKAELSGFSSFEQATFVKEAIFHNSKFRDRCSFRYAEFQNNAQFLGSVFGDEVDFTGGLFDNSVLFERTRFQGRAFFMHRKFTMKNAAESEVPNFRECHFEMPANFSEAEFSISYPDFADSILHDKTTFTKNTKQCTYWPDKTQQDLQQAKSSCATIRHVLAKQGLAEEEHFFFRREMQFASKIGSFGQKLPYLIFGWLSDYGHSIARPLVGLAIVWAVGFACFWGFFAGCCVPKPSIVIDRPFGSAIGLSFSNLFPLFGFNRLYFGAEFMKFLPASLKAISSIQTVVSLPLLFFLGLGLRQRFRLR